MNETDKDGPRRTRRKNEWDGQRERLTKGERDWQREIDWQWKRVTCDAPPRSSLAGILSRTLRWRGLFRCIEAYIDCRIARLVSCSQSEWEVKMFLVGTKRLYKLLLSVCPSAVLSDYWKFSEVYLRSDGEQSSMLVRANWVKRFFADLLTDDTS